MSIRKKIEDNLQLALKEKNRILISTLRLIMAGIKDKDIAFRSKDNKEGIKDEDIKHLLKKMIKQRKDSMSQFLSAEREELAQKEEREIETLSEFLPEQLSEEEIKELVAKSIIELNAETPQDIGKVMSTLKPALQGKADMSLVSKLVKISLTK